MKCCMQDPGNLVRCVAELWEDDWRESNLLLSVASHKNTLTFKLLSGLGSCFYLCRSCRYGGEDEYYVHTRETGLHSQEHIKSQTRTEITKEQACTELLFDF